MKINLKVIQEQQTTVKKRPSKFFAICSLTVPFLAAALLFCSHSYAEVSLDLSDTSVRELLVSADTILAKDTTKSLRQANEALTIAKNNNDIPSQLYALIVIGHILEADDKKVEAGEYYERAMATEQSSTNFSADHNILFYLADGLRVTKKYNDAQRYLERGIALQKQGNDPAYLMHAFDLQSTLYRLQKNYMQSIKSSENSFSIAQVLNSRKFRLRAYRKIAQAHKKMSNYRQSLSYNQQAFDLVKQDGGEQEIARHLEYLSTDQRSLGLYPEALENAKKALSVQRKYNNIYRISNLLLNISIIYLKISSYDESLSYALELLSIHEKTGDLNRIASASNQVGKIYNRLKRYDDATYYHERTLSLDKNKVQRRYRASAVRTLANIKYSTGEYDLALDYTEKGLRISKEINDLRGEASAYQTLAKIFYEKGNIIKAAKNCEKSIQISTQVGDKWSESRGWIYNGLIFIDNDLSKSQASLNKGLAIAQTIQAKSLQRDAYKALKTLEKNKNNFKKALNYSEYVEKLTQEIDNQKIDDRISELKIVQETQKKEQEIEQLKRNMLIRDLELNQKQSELEILNNKNTISELELKDERSKLILFFTLTVIFALVLAFLFMRYQYLRESQKILNDRKNEIEKKNANLEELNHTKDRFFSIISHDLRTPISSIVALADMLKDNFHSFSNDDIKRYVYDIQKAGDRTFSLLENLLSWAIIQLRNADPMPRMHQVKDVCDSAISHLTPSAHTKNITIDCSIPDFETFYADKNMISTVMRNLIGNAIKFTPHNGHISVYSRSTTTHISIHVKDTGVGITELAMKDLFNLERLQSSKGTDGESGIGFGLALSKDLVEKNKGNLFVETEIDKGSDFFFTLPRE